MEDDKLALAIFGIVAVLFFVTLPWCVSTTFLSSEVTVFPISHVKEKGDTALDRMVFTVFPERQEVICTVLGAEASMTKLQNCVVRNKENWSCGDFLVDQTMIDGNFHESPSYSVYYTNGWKWWFLRLKGY